MTGPKREICSCAVAGGVLGGCEEWMCGPKSRSQGVNGNLGPLLCSPSPSPATLPPSLRASPSPCLPLFLMTDCKYGRSSKHLYSSLLCLLSVEGHVCDDQAQSSPITSKKDPDMTRGWTLHRPTFFIRAPRLHPVHPPPPLASPPRPSPTDSRFHVSEGKRGLPCNTENSTGLPWNDTIKWGLPYASCPPPRTSKLIFFSSVVFLAVDESFIVHRLFPLDDTVAL